MILGLIVSPAVAIALMVVVGASNAVLDVAGFTLLQRAVPNAARVAVMGLLISGAGATMAIGGFVAPILVDGLGIEGALVATGVDPADPRRGGHLAGHPERSTGQPSSTPRS